jgi:hypothetical protein
MEGFDLALSKDPLDLVISFSYYLSMKKILT